MTRDKALKRNNYAEVLISEEFSEFGLRIFESEQLTDNLISIYLALMSNGWAGVSRGTPLPLDCLGKFYQNGLWLSCVPRIAISGQIDRRNDGVAEFSAIPLRSGAGFEFVSVQRVPALPHGTSGMPLADMFFWAGRTLESRHGRMERRLNVNPLVFEAGYFCLIGDRIFPTKERYGWLTGGPAAAMAIEVAAALQAVADLRSMWLVETSERTFGSTSMETPIRLGVNSEIIKSLFYSRDLPITESGRKRPILHWVRAHLRRLSAGVDVDISKHLRGTEKFEMGGFKFSVTNPVKVRKAA